MMVDTATPGPIAIMKTILINSAEHLAAVLARFRGVIRASFPRPEGFEYRRSQHVPLPADPSRIPTYLRRRRVHR